MTEDDIHDIPDNPEVIDKTEEEPLFDPVDEEYEQIFPVEPGPEAQTTTTEVTGEEE